MRKNFFFNKKFRTYHLPQNRATFTNNEALCVINFDKKNNEDRKKKILFPGHNLIA